MVEHVVWCGEKYKDSEERICIIGESHYLNKDGRKADTPQLTRDVISARKNHCEWLRFHLAVEHSFREGASLWDTVLFLNFFPRVLTEDDKDDLLRRGRNSEIVKDARNRLNRILQAEMPNKLFVFSRKAWKLMPETEEERAGQKELEPLTSKRRKARKFEHGTYKVLDSVGKARSVHAYGLQHPRPYSPDLIFDLQRAVQVALGREGQGS